MYYFYVYLLALIMGIILTATGKYRTAGKILLNLVFITTIFSVAYLGAVIVIIATGTIEYVIFLLIFALTIIILISCLIWGVLKKKYLYIPVICTLVLTAVSFVGYQMHKIYEENIPTVGEPKDLLPQYAPYIDGSKTPVLNEPATLRLENDLPVLDGATALYPVYSAFAKAVYPKEMIGDIAVKNGSVITVNPNEYLKCSKTTKAYENIVRGNADIIFVAAPSKKQVEFAKEQGVELIYTPVGKEAFVFFVNAKNPIEDISPEQIQQIYSGEITSWNELGVNLGEILAFQRDEGSGSQSALQRLMQGKTLESPPTNEIITGMGGIIEQTADYKNYKNAIGFSFRFYSTEMVKNNQIKLLRISGVYPNTDNIENGTYPISSEFYAVTRSDAGENTRRFIEWILSSQGQELIELTGYTPLK